MFCTGTEIDGKNMITYQRAVKMTRRVDYRDDHHCDNHTGSKQTCTTQTDAEQRIRVDCRNPINHHQHHNVHHCQDYLVFNNKIIIQLC